MSEESRQSKDAHEAPVDIAAEREPSQGSEGAQSEVEALRQEAEEHWNKYLRAVADLENLRKRNARELENARKFGAERLASAILPVRDSLEAALAASQAADPATLDLAAMREGDEATLRLLDQALAAADVREIDPHGEPFDPNKHEAMTLQPSATVEPDTVLEVVQKGYELHERLLRPARVIVSKAP